MHARNQGAGFQRARGEEAPYVLPARLVRRVLERPVGLARSPHDLLRHDIRLDDCGQNLAADWLGHARVEPVQGAVSNKKPRGSGG